ncbi:MAG: DUF885 domain-containing protein [Candidatus Krumholzibacteria bacterium]|nr:DUF885 domain-containing protein [Candidatus Krumholzibacteria bacterium]
MILRKSFVIALGASAALLAIACAGCDKGGGENAKFERLTKRYFRENFRTNPTLATWAGEHRYDHDLDDMSRTTIDAEIAEWKSYLAALGSLETAGLSPDNRIDAEILANNIKLDILLYEDVRTFEADPMLYTNLLGNSIYYLIARDFAPLDERLDAAADRLLKFPLAVEQAMANLSNPPKPYTEMAISQNRGLIALIERDLPREAEKAPGKKKKIEKAANVALDALHGFQTFLEKDLLDRSLGEYRLGDEVYRRLTDGLLQSDMSSEEIVAAAYAEIERVHGEMYELAVPLFKDMTGTEPPANPDRAERTSIVRQVLDEIAKDHPKPAELLDACKAAYAEAAAFVRERDIITIPQEPVEIAWAPDYSRGLSIVALEAPGPLDRGMEYRFVVSPVPEDYDQKELDSYLREYNSEMIRLVTIHEAMPGHYVQFAFANRNPSMVRGVCFNSAFVEGWGVYSMDLMNELGFREGDARFDLTWKKFYLRVLTNAIIDSGMHREGMTESEALRLLTGDGFQEESEAAIKWRRAMVNPGYLSTYFSGYLEIRQLRLEAEERLGGRFSLKEFHEKLLRQGALSPRLAREAMFRE